MSEQQSCPACGVTIVALVIFPWGDGQQRIPVAPWICASCAALGLIDLATGDITLTPEALWAPVQARNPALWQDIVTAIARIKEDAP